MTDDFCVISKSATGAPGISEKGKNGYKCYKASSLPSTYFEQSQVIVLVPPKLM